MHRVLAIASVTLKDALRKKVLFTILFFAVLLTVTSGFLPHVTVDEQIIQATRVSLSGIGFFGMIVAIFLAAPNLPDDISKKTIFTVMTKPARRWEILAGKIVGLGYVLAILLAIMGALSYILINLWAWKAGQDPNAPPRLESNRYNYASTIDYQGLTLKVSPPMIESKRAIVSGLDRITYHFDGLDKESFSGDSVFAEVTLFSHAWTRDPVTGEGTAALQVSNPTTGEVQEIVFEAPTLTPRFEGFRRGLVDSKGQLDITVLRHLPTGNYSAMAGSVAVLSQPSSYGMNFVKALGMRFVQYMVLVFVATAASTFLTSTVSTITALFIYFTGSLVEVLRTEALSLGTKADIFTMAEHTHEQVHEEISRAAWFVNILLRDFYLGISVIFPDLDYFDVSASISQNQHIAPSTMALGVFYAAVYSAVCFAFAWLVFRRKEVA